MSTPTTSRTAAAETFSIFFSSARQLELHDLLDAAGAEPHGDAHVEAVDRRTRPRGSAVQGSTRFSSRQIASTICAAAAPGRVPGGGAEQLDELAAALPVRSTIFVILPS